MYSVWTRQLQFHCRPHRGAVVQLPVSLLLCVGRICHGGRGMFLSVTVLGLHTLHRRRSQKVMTTLVFFIQTELQFVFAFLKFQLKYLLVLNLSP